MFGPYLNLLKKRNFFLLLLGQIISQFGDKLTQIALIGLVSSLSPSSFSLAFTMSMGIIPVILFSPISGVYVDRWNKRSTMYVCEALRGFLILGIIFLYLKLPYLSLIYGSVFLSFTIGRFFLPAKMAFLPQVVEKEELFLANSLISITATTASILGFGLGGIIVEGFGIEVAFFIDALTFFISGFLIILINVKEKIESGGEDIFALGKDLTLKIKRTFLQELKDGIRYIFTSGETNYAFRIFFFLFASVGAVFPAFTRFIQEVLGSFTRDLGFIGVSLGGGIFLGSLVYGRIGSYFPIKKISNLSILFCSLFLIAFSFILKSFPYGFLAISLSIAMGILISPIFIAVVALVHRQSKGSLLGRVFSSLEFIAHLGFLCAMFIFAYLADLFSPFTILMVVGIINTLFVLIFMRNDFSKGV